MGDPDEVVDDLVRIEARLRERAFDRLREATEGDATAEEDERRLHRARRSIAKAIRELGGEPERGWD